MKTSNLSLACLLLVSIFMFGCKADKKQVTDNSQPNTEKKDTVVTPPPPPPPPTPLTKLCGNADFDIEREVISAAQALTGFDYIPEKNQDCSGMFHRVLDKFRVPCPEANLPTLTNARSTRGLAAWYNENGEFKIIRDPEKNADLIKVGAVMFYGYGKRRKQYDFQNMNMDTLTTRHVGINHVSIVTKVNRVNGVLESYEMFHGRTFGKKSSVTTSHRVTSWDPTLPMYGNSYEPWLGIAQVFGKK